MDEKYFDPLANEAWHTLRLLNYPPVSKKLLEAEGQARAGAHSGMLSPCFRLHGWTMLNACNADYGSLTFVFQDNVGFPNLPVHRCS